MDKITFKANYSVTVDGETEVATSMDDLWNMINIPDTADYKEARDSIVRYLVVFREIDLSYAYPGHSVAVTLEFVEEE